jgi:hypothetical protein
LLNALDKLFKEADELLKMADVPTALRGERDGALLARIGSRGTLGAVRAT